MEISASLIDWHELLYYLPLGAVAGVMAGLLGVGGGLVIVPALIWIYSARGFDPSFLVHMAVGTSLATIVATSISSIYAHHRRGAVIWGTVWRLTAGILVGAYLGAELASWMSGDWLRRVFAVFVLVVGWRMLIGAKTESNRKLPGIPAMTGVGGVIGAVSSIVGIGGGSMTVPFLSSCGVNIRNAVATSSACGLPIALAGTAGFMLTGWRLESLPPATSGYVYWPAVLAISVASVVFAPVGAHLAHKLPVITLKRVFAVLLLVIGLKLLMG